MKAYFTNPDLNITAQMSADEISKELNRADRLWGREALSNNPEDKQKAEKMLELIDAARRDLGTESALNAYKNAVRKQIDELLSEIEPLFYTGDSPLNTDVKASGSLEAFSKKAVPEQRAKVLAQCKEVMDCEQGIPLVQDRVQLCKIIQGLCDVVFTVPVPERSFRDALEPLTKRCLPFLENKKKASEAALSDLFFLNQLCCYFLLSNEGMTSGRTTEGEKNLTSIFRASARTMTLSADAWHQAAGHFQLGFFAHYYDHDRNTTLEQFRLCIQQGPGTSFAKTAQRNIDAINKVIAQEEAEAEAERRRREEEQRQREEAARAEAERQRLAAEEAKRLEEGKEKIAAILFFVGIVAFGAAYAYGGLGGMVLLAIAIWYIYHWLKDNGIL